MTKFKKGDRVQWNAFHNDYAGDDGKPVKFGVVLSATKTGANVLFDTTTNDLFSFNEEITLVKTFDPSYETEEVGYMNQFVEVKKNIRTVIGGVDSGYASVSVVPFHQGNINVVVGAEYEDRAACCFSKRTLQELINNLQEVCDLMGE